MRNGGTVQRTSVEEEGVCYSKRECDYDIYAIWRRFIKEESILREYSDHVTSHFCAPDVNGTLQIFRDGAVVPFPPWLEQKPIVETVVVEYGIKHPECETKYVNLDRDIRVHELDGLLPGLRFMESDGRDREYDESFIASVWRT